MAPLMRGACLSGVSDGDNGWQNEGDAFPWLDKNIVLEASPGGRCQLGLSKVVRLDRLGGLFFSAKARLDRIQDVLGRERRPTKEALAHVLTMVEREHSKRLNRLNEDVAVVSIHQPACVAGDDADLVVFVRSSDQAAGLDQLCGVFNRVP